MRKTYQGSCHCGSVRFECELDLADGTSKCNCRSIRHLFCARCGIKPFGRGYLDELGGGFYAVNVACLDAATDEELAAAPVRYEDGRNNDWNTPPRETGYL